MGKKPTTKKSTSQKHCESKGVTTPVARNKAAKGNNNRSVVTSERGSSSTPYHKNPADHPLFGVRRYTHKNHNSSDPVLHVNVTDHLSYKSAEEGVCSVGPNFQASEIKIPSWSIQVVGWGDTDDCEVLDIPRVKSSTCLPLPEDVKYVSASTATELLDMISGLNSLLFTKCMAARTIISELRQGTHTQHNQNPLARKETADAEDENEIDDEDDEEDEDNVEDEEAEEDEEVEENGDEDENDPENDQEDEEDDVLVEETKTKSSPPNTKGKGAVVKTKCKGGAVHSKEKAAAIKGKGKASPQKRKTSLSEPEPRPISKRLQLRKKT